VVCRLADADTDFDLKMQAEQLINNEYVPIDMSIPLASRQLHEGDALQMAS
jgi:hypothetical protein